MAAYPSVAQTSGTTVTPKPGIDIDISTSGTLRGVNKYVEEVADITVEHDLIDTTDKDSIITFYTSNKATEFTFTYNGDSTVYDCLFTSKPQVTWIAPGLWKVTSKLIGKLQ